MSILTLKSLTRLYRVSALLHLSATIAAAGAEIPAAGQVTPDLLSKVEKRDSQSIRRLRSVIFDRACESNVVKSLATLATNKALKYEEVDLIVHAAVFCTEQGKQLLETMLTTLDLGTIKRPEVQALIAEGLYGLVKSTNRVERVLTYWQGINGEQNAATGKLSDGDVEQLIGEYRTSKTSGTRDKVREILTPLAALGRTNLLFMVAKELAVLDPGDPYSITYAAKILFAVDGKTNEALSYLRKAWGESRHLPALEIYAGAVMAVASSGSSAVSPAEVRAIADDLLRFQDYDVDYTAILLAAGALLRTDDLANRDLVKRHWRQV